ncbi:pyridine nucleotide-disulfide oxidoreductase [Bacillus sp. FJAT-42376]|uniref:FAD-dependent oxidoreductase n=1 Tax=Bacillus sp. FJAT-42376 TaxID=2014076 RepID=UPI000F4FE557|nr:FAD-dependent oxidoreductase [Bacillus sp. FJAT-42376]AZB41359.1 pyridine nucleotide-disulfide oxidoreductase [Bacillus sp. FJAT-42376]
MMKTIVLAGGGHAHLAGISKGALKDFSNTRFILISPSRYQYYSGMFSGFTEGIYKEEEIRIDLMRLSGKHGFTFVEEEVTAIDSRERMVITHTGRSIPYDLLSIDIGSAQASSPFSLPIKPNYTFPEAILSFREGPAPVIAGGGASGTELSFAAAAYRRKRGIPGPVTLISSGPLLSPGHTKRLEQLCREKGVNTILHEKARLLDTGTMETGNGTIRFSHLLFLTGPEAPGLFKASGLETDERGFLQVDERLMYNGSIFGAGDCISISGYPDLPKNGVYAVRQSPILWENLKRAANHLDPVPFSPQKRFLAILSTGGKEGFLTYGGFHVHGKAAWQLKHAIDRRYMNSF